MTNPKKFSILLFASDTRAKRPYFASLQSDLTLQQYYMLTVKIITKTFGNTTAVDALSFEVNPGEIVGLLGPNGAGKTTTMRVISGFLAPDGGTTNLNNISVLKNPTKAQKLIGYLPENNPLYKEMLVSEFLNTSLELKGIHTGKRDALDFIVDAVGIKDVYYHPIKELSKGYKQRVGLAQALLNKPQLLILDEPTEGLDPNQRAEIRKLIKELSEERTVIISTHVLQEVEALCSRVIIINKGKKVADGGVSELASNLKEKKQPLFIRIEGRNAQSVENKLKKTETIEKVAVETIEGNILQAKLFSKSPAPLQPKISELAKTNNWIIWELSEDKTNLESVFKELTT